MKTKNNSSRRRAAGLTILIIGCLFVLYFIFGLTLGWDVYFGTFIFLLFGVFLTIGGTLMLKGYRGLFGIQGLLGNRFRIFRIIISIGLAVFLISFILIEGIIIYNGARPDTAKSDYLIVLGAGMKGSRPSLELRGRLDKSLEYIESHPDINVVVSGGQGSGEDMSEAQFMRQYLINHGVPAENIICEDKSTSTYENIVYSKKLIERADKRKNIKLTIVTNDFHIFRSEFLARREGFIAYGYPTGTPIYIIPNHYLREYFAVIKSALFDKA